VKATKGQFVEQEPDISAKAGSSRRVRTIGLIIALVLVIAAVLAVVRC